MRTRSFIGLILLVAILMIVSIPALMEPAAAGTEQLGIKVGLLPDQAALAEYERKKDAAQSTEPVENKVLLKGHVVDVDTGDLRDTATATQRASNEHGRLAEGDRRVLLPGQLEDQDAYSRPPVLSEDGVLLDVDGCPVFADNVDVSALFADPDVEQKYADKAASADDADACTTSIQDRVTADQEAAAVLLPGDRRQSASMIRSDSDRLLFDLHRLGLYDTFFGDVDTAKTVTDIRSSLAAN